MSSNGEDPSGRSDLQVLKICEFFAHVDAVTCAHIGRRSNQLLATGSADRLVNVWKIGDPRAQLTLSGHSDTVFCLKFTGDEETLLSGCRDGSIRIWDLNHDGASKRRIPGQNRAITAIDPHPYLEYFATGTIDGKLEIWNARQRQKIAEYRGNNSPISVLKFSPDGHYVFGGHASGAIKVWNLRAAKLLAELPSRDRGQVNAIAFNTQEMAFSSGSESGLIEVFEVCEQDINTFGTTEIYAPVRQMVFNGSGDMLLCASDAYVGVMSVDQPQIAHLAYRDDVSFTNLVDLSYDANDSLIIAASIDNTAVTVHSIAASQNLNFATKLYQPAVKELFMGPRRKKEKEPPGFLENRTHDFFESSAKNTTDNDLLSEHAIDDYLAVENILPLLLSDHESIMETLNDRLTKVKQLSEWWSHCDVIEVLNQLIQMKDYAVTAGFLASTQGPFNGGVLTLQLCPALLSVVDMLMQSPHKGHIKTALNCLEMILLCYSEVIASTRKGPVLTACDVAREERLNKCNECYEIVVGPIWEKLQLIAEGSEDLNEISSNLVNQIRRLA